MPRAHVVRESQIVSTSRVKQLLGLFDIPPASASREEWEVELPLEEREWQIGLIVGPSGAGKTTLAREVFGGNLIQGFDWPAGQAIVDGFPAGLSIKEITGALNAVGFSSPPAWLRPFAVLSTGQQFRVTLARALLECPAPVVVDEFTSVVDRTVAQIGSAAVAKAVRKGGKQFVAVTCHYDVTEWLQPDWVYEPHLRRFQWRCLQRRPDLVLSVYRVHHSVWEAFRGHHYLSGELNRASHCYAGLIGDSPACFASTIRQPLVNRQIMWREHRTVVLPEFQGVGIGNRFSEEIARIYQRQGARYVSVTSHPAMNGHRARSPLWRCYHRPAPGRAYGRGGTIDITQSRAGASGRLITRWEFVGP